MSLRIERIEDNDVRYRLRQDLAEMNGLIDATLYYLRDRDDGAGPRQRVDVQALLQAIVDDAELQEQDVRLSGTAAPLLAYPAGCAAPWSTSSRTRTATAAPRISC